MSLSLLDRTLNSCSVSTANILMYRYRKAFVNTKPAFSLVKKGRRRSLLIIKKFSLAGSLQCSKCELKPYYILQLFYARNASLGKDPDAG